MRQTGMAPNTSSPIYLDCWHKPYVKGPQGDGCPNLITGTCCDVGAVGLVWKLSLQCGHLCCKALRGSRSLIPLGSRVRKGPLLFHGAWVLGGTEKVAITTFFQLFCLHFVSTVPQQGKLLITTEFGKMLVEPNEICVIQVRADCACLWLRARHWSKPAPAFSCLWFVSKGLG